MTVKGQKSTQAPRFRKFITICLNYDCVNLSKISFGSVGLSFVKENRSVLVDFILHTTNPSRFWIELFVYWITDNDQTFDKQLAWQACLKHMRVWESWQDESADSE